MGFLNPALLLLAMPVLLAWWRLRGGHSITAALRLAFALLLLAGLAGMYLHTGSKGRDLVLVVDRSRSMPADAEARAIELVALAEKERQAEDRVYVVAFGADAQLEHAALEDARFAGFDASVDRDGSDLAAALESSLDLLDGSRPASVLLVSDGLVTGRDPLPAARRAYARGVSIDVRPQRRSGAPDLLVERIELPDDVAVGEPFQFQVWVHAAEPVRTDFSLMRAGRVLSSGERDFPAGRTRLVFRDRLTAPGVSEYTVELGADDAIPENNRARAAVRGRGAEALLVLNEDGAEDTLVQALRQAGMPTVVQTPEAARLDPVGLTAFRAVVLENVPAHRLGPHMEGLASWVRDHGGGLWMTGGRASFGMGGYYLSPIEQVLPVTMELRQEHRKLSLAMAVALDRSGSMGASAGPTTTKMDLANLGTWSALELLSPLDHASVVAVDSSPHVIVPMQSAKNLPGLRGEILGIESMGGGIFVLSALRELVRQLEDAPQSTRHLVLFSDAADSEEQGGCFELVRELRAESNSTTLSVVALGTEADCHAQFLIDLAALGGGEAYFTQDPGALPRIFAQDTLTVSRSTFIEDATAVNALPDLLGLGSAPIGAFPTVTGYNLSYLRPQAQAGLVTEDEFHAPLFAFGYQGLGRSAIFAAQIGGSDGSEIVAWSEFSAFATTVARWLVGTEEPSDVFVDTSRQGRDASIRIELDETAPVQPGLARLAANLTAPDGTTRRISLLRTGPAEFEARVPLRGEGSLVGTVELGAGRSMPLPPLTLPYSPEFERIGDDRRGERLLARIATESGGQVGSSVAEAFAGKRQGSAWRPLTRELAIAAILLLLVEIAGRRLGAWESLGARLRQRAQPAGERKAETQTERPAMAPASPPAASGSPLAPPPRGEEGGTAPGGGLGAALEAARKVSDRKLDR